VAPKLITTELITKACKELHLNFSYATKNKTVLNIHFPNKDHFIINSNLGLISSTKAHLCLDKAYQYEILSDVVNLPETTSYLDPHSKYSEFTKLKSHQEIKKDIINNNSFPIIVKKNTGTEGENVFLCHNEKELTKAINNIFNLNSSLYDHVLLVQEYINIKNEYRAIFYKHQLELLYKKDNHQAEFIGNLSPLHFEGAKAIEISDQNLQEKITKFVTPIFTKLDLIYGGFDIAEDQNGQFYLIEINSVPGYAHYLENNREEKLLTLFKKILGDLNK